MMNDTFLRTTRARQLILVGLSAVLLLGTTPYVDIPYVSLFAFVPFLLLIHTGISQRRRFWLGLVLGAIYGIALLLPFFSVEGWWFTASPLLFAWKTQLWAIAIIAAALVFFGLPFATFFALYRTPQKYLVVHTILFAFLWSTLEYIRAVIVFDLSWGHLGYTLHNSASFLQLASIIGVYGMSAFIVAVNIFLSVIYVRARVHKDRRITPYVYPTAGIALMVLPALLYGQIAHQAHTAFINESTGVEVAVLHTRIDRNVTRSDDAFTQYRALLEEAAQSADIVVAPESIFHPIEIDRTTYRPVGYHEPQLSIRTRYDALRETFVAHPDTAFVLGLKTKQEDERYSSIVIFEDGAIVDIYDKRILLPFAEEGESLHVDRVVPALNPGSSEQDIGIKGYTINASVCSEIVYPRLYERDRAFIVNVSNEEAFPSSALKKQNHVMAKFRAVEHRQYLLRATKDGHSSIIAPTGEVLAVSNEDETQILRATIYVE